MTNLKPKTESQRVAKERAEKELLLHLNRNMYKEDLITHEMYNKAIQKIVTTDLTTL